MFINFREIILGRKNITRVSIAALKLEGAIEISRDIYQRPSSIYGKASRKIEASFGKSRAAANTKINFPKGTAPLGTRRLPT